MTEQETFLTELKAFILNHPHFKKQEGTHLEYQANDMETFEIQDPDGDYETIFIKLLMVS